jgi:V/A-type H+-transporting ATPase subunit I
MLVGDAGYGLLFLGMSFFAKSRLKAVPAHVFTLVNIMSVCTIVWGVVTGSWFGLTNLESLGGGLPAAFTIPWLTGDNAAGNIMLLTFLIGAVHLTIAHAWTFIRLYPSSQCWAQIGWILTTWTMFFAARSMVLLKDFPSVMFGVLTAGILLLVVFMVPPKRLKTEWVSLVMLPLNLISNFVDVVSYVRLFAVGAATFAVASAFNSMAMDMGFSGILTGLLSAFVLFFGHVLNILLAAMSVLVHGVRLNILEFAGHMGLTWAGVKYEPFVRRDDELEHKG